jgi:hypothetical protein
VEQIVGVFVRTRFSLKNKKRRISIKISSWENLNQKEFLNKNHNWKKSNENEEFLINHIAFICWDCVFISVASSS